MDTEASNHQLSFARRESPNESFEMELEIPIWNILND